MSEVIKIAALSDPHFGRCHPYSSLEKKKSEYIERIEQINSEADVLLVGGDWTDHGEPAEAEDAAMVFRNAKIPIVGVLGNHDYYKPYPLKVANILHEKAGIRVLERGEIFSYTKNGISLEVTGVVGYSHDYRKKVMGPGKVTQEQFESLIKSDYGGLSAGINDLDGDINVLLLHFPLVHKPDDTHVNQEAIKEDDAYDLRHIVVKNKDKIDLVLHGHKHSDGDPDITWEGLDIRNIASKPRILVDVFDTAAKPHSVTMAPGIPHRLIPLAPRRATIS